MAPHLHARKLLIEHAFIEERSAGAASVDVCVIFHLAPFPVCKISLGVLWCPPFRSACPCLTHSLPHVTTQASARTHASAPSPAICEYACLQSPPHCTCPRSRSMLSSHCYLCRDCWVLLLWTRWLSAQSHVSPVCSRVAGFPPSFTSSVSKLKRASATAGIFHSPSTLALQFCGLGLIS